MATNPPKNNARKGAVCNRSQFKAPNGNWTKLNSTTGRFMDQKNSSKTSFKGVRKKK